MKRAFPACLVAVAALAGAVSSQAAACEYTWGGSVKGNWVVGSNWSGGKVPVAGSSVCIASGSAELEQGGAEAEHLGSLTISAKGGLIVRIHQVLVSAATTIGPEASLTLNGAYEGANAGNASLGGGTVLNEGTITMEGGGYSATLYGTVTNRGTINIPFATVELGQGGNGGTGSFVNEGAINIAGPSSAHASEPAALSIVGYPFDNSTGTISNAGTINVFGANGVTGAFTQGSGPITGNEVHLGRSTSLAFTGAGAASFYVGNAVGTIPMSGSIAAGQNLTVAIGTGMEETGSFQNAGNITLNGNYPGCCGGNAAIIIAAGAMTNVGTITATSNDVETQFAGNVINDGTIAIAPSTGLEQSAGNFTNAGTLITQISSKGFGSLTIPSPATFTAGGTLLPTLEDGFVPGAGQEFKVIAGSSLSGTFGSIGSPFGVNYSQSGQISVVYDEPSTGPSAPPPPPAPAPPLAPVPATAHTGKLAGGRGTVSVKLSCPADGTACGPLVVRATITEHLKGSRLLAVSAAKKKTKVVTVATGTLSSLTAGGTRTLTLKLNEAGLALLKRFHSLKVIIAITENGKTLARATVLVRQPAKKH